METRIQFRVKDDIKHLAQQMAESQGRTLSDACRELIEHLAAQQKEKNKQEQWLTEQVNEAFAKYNAGQSTFLNQEETESEIERRKNEFKSKFQK